jgi:hypothetical protein
MLSRSMPVARIEPKLVSAPRERDQWDERADELVGADAATIAAALRSEYDSGRTDLGELGPRKLSTS